MWMVDEIFHAIFEIKEIRVCWLIHVSTKLHNDILNIIESLNSDVHEATKSVIE